MKKILLILSSCLFLFGCWDREEINDVAFVVGTGIDKKEDQFEISLQIPLVGAMGGQSGGGGGTSGDKIWYLDKGVGKTIREAVEQKQRSTSRTINFSHRRVVVIGEDYAKDGVYPAFDILARGQQNRLTAFIVISKGMASDVLNADAPIEQFPAEMLRELAIGATNKPIFLKSFMYNLREEGLDAYCPVVQLISTNPGAGGESKKNIEIAGLAIFKKDKLVDILDSDQAQYVLLAMNQANVPIISLPAPNFTEELNIQLQEIGTRITAKGDENNISMHIELNAVGVVVENTTPFQIRNHENKRQLQHHLERTLKTSMEDAIKSLQEKGADPIGFGAVLRRENKIEWKKIKKNWETVYPTISVSVTPRIHLEHEGVLSKSLADEGNS